ncbi:MAG: hypothetical protein ACKOTZ_11215 [Chloroflexota bacterium]
MTSSSLAFFTVDRGAATTAAALIAPVDGRYRLLAAGAVPHDADPDALLADLVARVVAVDPGLLGEPEAWAGWLRLACATAAAPRVVCAGTSDRSLAGVRGAFAAAGWEVAGAVLPGDAEVLAATELLLDAAIPAVAVATGDLAEADERAALPRLAALIGAIAARRPELRVLACGVPTEIVESVSADRVLHLPPPGDLPPARDPGLRAVLLELAGRGAGPAGAIPDGRAAWAAGVASLADLLGCDLDAIDIGHAAGARVHVQPDGALVHLVTTRGALVPAESIADEAALDAIVRWSSLRSDPFTLHDRLRNLALQPWRDTTGDGPRLRLAALRGALERIDAAWQVAAAPDPEAPPAPVLLLSGGVLGAVPPPATLLAVADTLRRPGARVVLADHARILAPIGTLPSAADRRRSLGDLLDDLLLPVGTTLGIPDLPEGERSGGLLSLATPFGAREVPLAAEELRVVDLPPGVTGRADVAIRSAGMRAAREEVRTWEVNGGLGGLLVDGRPIPLLLPDRAERRRALLEAWEQPAWGPLEA